MPEKWNKLPLRVDIFRWDKANRRWSETRWATAFGPVNGKRRMWQNLIALTAKTGSARETLIRKQTVIPPGTYLAKLYLDAEKKTAKNPDYELGKREFVGQVEFHGRWVLGYRKPKILHTSNFRKD
jgi:hypothetical protein